MCVFVFCGYICMISICVADNQLWLLWLNDGYQYECWSAIIDYMAHICMIIICTTIISVWLLTINRNQCERLAISGCVWQSEYVREYVQHTKQFFFTLFQLLKLF